MTTTYLPPMSSAGLAISLISLATIAMPATAIAQSTPTELADLSFEDLLNVRVLEDGTNTALKRWSFNYSFRSLDVGGYKSGTDTLSFDDVLFSPGEVRTSQNYPVVPTFIDQDVHAYSATYAATDTISLSIAVPFISQSTDHISSVPGFADFVLSTEGVGDIAVTASHQKRIENSGVLRSSVGIRIPTGSIDETGDTPRNGAGTLERLPYTMQLGSGTYDFTAAVNFSRPVGEFNFGAGLNTTIRTGLNDNGYRLGNNLGIASWGQYSKNHWFQPGVRVAYRHTDEISGRDQSLLVPVAFPFPASITDPSNFGGDKASVAFTIKACTDASCRLSLVADVSQPFYQNLNGVQPKERDSMSLGVQAQF